MQSMFDESDSASRWMVEEEVLQRRVLGLTIEGTHDTAQNKDLKPRWLLKLSLDILMKRWKALSLYSKGTSSEIKMRSVEIFHSTRFYLPVRFETTTRGDCTVPWYRQALQALADT